MLKEPPNQLLLVAAASNKDLMVRSYPAGLNEAIAVARSARTMVRRVIQISGRGYRWRRQAEIWTALRFNRDTITQGKKPS